MSGKVSRKKRQKKNTDKEEGNIPLRHSQTLSVKQ